MRRSVRLAKRFIDLVGASVGLAIALPLWPLIAIAIYLESPGSVFIRQVRAGQLRDVEQSPTGGAPRPRFHEFKMLKFRSMRPDAEKHTGVVVATANDPRITRVGKVLRKTRLDLKGLYSRSGPYWYSGGFNAFFADGHARFMKQTQHSNWLKNPDAKTGDKTDLPEYR